MFLGGTRRVIILVLLICVTTLKLVVDKLAKVGTTKNGLAG